MTIAQGRSMIRISRLALLASCSLSLVACAGVHGFGPPHPRDDHQATASPAAPPAAKTRHHRSIQAIAAAQAPANVWPQAYADLPPDPAMRFGTLPNGMRYVVMHNATPNDQASLRLRFAAGSMDETDEQRGLAHFLEHMAFDGSTHVPNGEMVKILQRHGLAFGADTNASTSWEETVYKLDLPKADEATLDDSLMLLRETASELTFAPDAIDKERGVVLSEERLRDTPGYRVLKQGMGFTLAGLRAPERFPIGQVEVIQKASHDQFVQFYAQYYRPENAVLVAVGDFDPDAMEAQIRTRFGDWTDRGPAGREPDLGAPVKRGPQTKLVVEPGAPPIVELSWVSPPDLSPDSEAKRRRDIIEALGLAVLNRRLDRIVRADDPPFLAAGIYRSDEFHSAKVTTLQVQARPGEWRAALEAASQEARRFARYGVSQDELNLEIESDRASFEDAANAAATRTTPSVADDIIGAVAIPEVETSPAEDLALFNEAVKTLTAAEVNAGTSSLVGGDGPLVLVSAPTPVDGGDQAVAKAFAAIDKEPLSPPVAHAALSWPYDSFGVPGAVADQRDITDLDTVFVRFANGVRLTVKPTKFRDEQILVEARVGDGDLDLPGDRQTTAWAADSAFPEGGLDQLSAQDIDQVMNSKILAKNFGVGEDAYVLSGETRPEDLDSQLQLLAAYVAHPGWRPEAFDRMKKAGPTILDQLDATPAGVLNRDLGQLLHSGDRRWAYPDRADIAAETPAEFKTMLQPALADGPIEVVVVGDITVDKAIDAVAATFGALPPRSDAPPPSSSTAVAFPRPTPTPIVLTHKGRADQAIGLIAWPTDDFLSDTQRARTLNMLANVLQLRLLDQFRKAQGVTYSPSAQAAASSVLPHYGYLSARVEVPPAELDAFFRDVETIVQDLKAKPVSDDEFKRAQLPALDDLERRRQTNEYWLGALAAAQTDPRRVDAIRSSIAQLERVTPEDVQRAAQNYLVDDKAWKLVVKPQGAS
jgi:zinc protease